ncbi:MAG: hypothetical protein GTN67_01425 [Hydrotalea flava]|uniref:hypothetical protein n=1 Tax=Hydrotalea TaxID=1004300 RepID=UPI0016B9AA60|nr:MULTISPECIES: hypothetical protein [Hydrotalea]MBY0347315.1 hypothetical protein [Hydrotalea flava]NIM34156.1 hypothetical protein [Hydrotalea flava]NIM36980.1 hypothetical protein [Hydrotalea flava]NIN02172.1 hypothetical protein [Hydrotalea flava]NIN13825.1 hypothetical protein [Hydrotalea flava]
MKTQQKQFFANLTQLEVAQLTAETKETIASAAILKTVKPVLSAANLWNIHRMRKVRGQRRYLAL